MKFISSLLFLLYANTISVTNAQFENITFNFTGAQPCPEDAETLGYSNITIMNEDMLYDAYQKFKNDVQRLEYIYTLCPNTKFDMDAEDLSTSIMPLLNNTAIQCGKDGSSDNNCILEGGHIHVLFGQGIYVKNVLFKGLTFTRNYGVSVGAWAYSKSFAAFNDCHFKSNTGVTLIEMYFNPTRRRRLLSNNDRRTKTEKMEIGLVEGKYRDLLENNNSDRYRFLRQVRDQNLYQLQEDKQRKLQGFPAMKISLETNTFADNFLDQAVVLDGGGILQIYNTKFARNAVGVFTIGALYGAQVYFHAGTSFNNNTSPFFIVYVDSNSILELNDATKTTTSVAPACPNGVFIENDNSYCLYQGGTCHGACCAFGNITCDQFVSAEEATAQPDSNLELAGGQESVPGFGQSSPSESGGGCGSTCVALAVLMPLLVIGILIVAFVLYRKKKKSTGGVPQLGNQPTNEIS